MAADAKVGSELIKVTAVDNDIGNNSVIIYLIVTIQYIRLQSNETEDMGDIFIIGTHILHACPCVLLFIDTRVVWDPALFRGYSRPCEGRRHRAWAGNPDTSRGVRPCFLFHLGLSRQSYQKGVLTHLFAYLLQWPVCTVFI